MAINERLIHTAAEAAAAGTGNQEEGLILHLDANDVDSYDGDGSVWYDITNHEYTPSVNPAENFNIVTYTGNGTSNTTEQSITGVGFQPDLVWIKNRGEVRNHVLVDSLRKTGSLLDELHTNTQDAANTGGTDNVKSMDSDGFTVLGQGSETNDSGDTFVAWCFKAGGAAVSNTDGDNGGSDVTSSVSANTDLGFSIVKWTDINSSGTAYTVGHGLDVPPELIITKEINDSGNWVVYSKNLRKDKYLFLHTNAAFGSLSNVFGAAEPTATVFGQQSGTSGTLGKDMVAYCFASKRGISKVGSYTGTGAAGNKVYTGFEPAWVMIKNADSTGAWNIMDNKRDTDNPREKNLWADTGDTEATASQSNVYDVDFDRDGFTIQNHYNPFNKNGDTIIYLAFAKNTKETQLTPEKGDFAAEDTVTTGAELEFDANDYSGSGNWLNTGNASSSDGTITGASYVNDGTSDYFSFDGNDYITSSSSGLTANTYTIEAWFYMDSLQTAGIVSWGDQGANYERRSMITWNGGGSNYYLYSSTYASNIRGNTILEAGRWYHGVITMDNGQANIYLNGEHDGSGTNTLSAYTSSTLYIGRTAEASEIFSGDIAVARVYDTVLTSAQIKANYDATYGLYQHADLKLHLDAGDDNSYSGSGSTWGDLANSNDATITGASYDKELGNFFSFDGTNDEMTLSGSTSLTDRTVEMWYKTNDKSNNYWIFDSTPDSGSTNSFGVWAMYMDSTYIYGIGSKWNGSTYGAALVSSSTITEGKWHHIVFTCKNSEYKIYVDGQKLSQLSHVNYTTSRNIDSATLSNINFMGTRSGYTGGSYFAEGDIGQIRMYSTVLTESQIRQNYNFTKNDYPNGVHFTNAGDRANWLSEGSWNFDSGANEYFTHTSGAFKGRIGTGNFAVSAWVNTDSVSSASKFVINTRGYSDGSNQGWGAYIYEDDIWFDAKNGTNKIPIKVHNVLSTNTWHHIVWQRTDSIWECYLDGTLQTNSSTQKTDYLTADLGGSDATDSDLIIGRYWQTNNYQWDGRLSDIKIFNKALTSAEVTAEYDKGQFGDK